MTANVHASARDPSWERSIRPDDALVRHLSGFVPLSDGERARLAELTADARPVAARTDLVGEGEEMGSALVVLDGFACRYRGREDGRRQILTYLLPGDLCDLDVALLGPLDHAVVTITACRVAFVPRGVLLDVGRHQPRIVQALRLAKLAQEARARDWVMALGCGTASERVAHLFCEVVERLRAVGLSTEDGCPFPVTQATLGETAGLSTVHVNRTLQALRGEGLVELRNKELRILDPSRLRTLAGFRPQVAHVATDHARPSPEGARPTSFGSRRPRPDEQRFAE